MKQSKPSSAQFRKWREARLKTMTRSKEFMKDLIQGKSNSQCPKVTENEASNYNQEMDVVSDEMFLINITTLKMRIF